ncbi:MAG TPA: thioredoxin domain-containing protein [Bryobacteraceae bacterium]|nr:thioredoxin domain-containing protein [Bryobacteraceae bacterium]
MRFCAALLALAGATAGLSDTLTLRDGRVVQGTYMGGTARTIKMQVDDSTKTFDVTEVASLQFTAPAAASETTKPGMEGRADSSVRAVIYEDLQCPDCAAFRRMLDETLLPKYGGKVCFEHRDFPLAKHAWARRAAIAARFFAERDAALGLEYRRETMAGQEAATAENFNQRLTAFAQAHHIDPAEAIAALSNPAYAALVDRDYQDGVGRGVVHTPTVFVNGRPFIETFTVDEISKGIDEALAQAR